MVGRRDIDRYTSAIDVAVKAAERQLAGFLAGLDLSQPGAIDALAAYVEALAQQYGTVAAAAAADWYEELRAADGLTEGYAALVDDIIDSARIQHSTRYLATSGDPQTLASRLGGLLQRHICGAGRQTVNANMDADPADVRYARIPRGPKTCAFCSMLASRGWVYRSKETASQRKRGGRYHDRCDCAIVPSWGPHAPSIDGYDPDALYEQYMQARDAAGTGDESAILAEMRRQHPDRYTDGVKPGQSTLVTPLGERMDDRAGIFDRSRVKHLEQHEIDAARAIAWNGYNVTAIPRGDQRSPDFDIGGVRWELKNPKGNSATTMANQLDRANGQSPNVIIGLARTAMSEKEAIEQLKQAWLHYPEIERIVLLTKTGRLREVSRP